MRRIDHVARRLKSPLSLLGQCGMSLGPCTHESRASISSSIGAKPMGDWTSYGELLAAMDDAQIATNVVGMVGHGALRHTVMGPFSFTTGLEYHPGKNAAFDELAALCSAVACVDGLYATHSRNRDTRYFVGFGEALDVARVSGVRLQISHVNPKYGRPDRTMSNTLQMIEWSRDEGLDVAMDMMPTNWNHTAANAMLPSWSAGLSNEELIALMRSRDGRRRLRHNPLPMWQLLVEERWDRVRLLSSSANRDLVGQTIADIAERRNATSGWNALFDLMIDEGDRIKGLMLTGHAPADWPRLPMANTLVEFCAAPSRVLASRRVFDLVWPGFVDFPARREPTPWCSGCREVSSGVMNHSRTHCIILSTLCLGAVVVGCGSDDEGLSAAQFREQANAICAEGSAEIGEAAGAAFAGEPTPEALQGALDTIVMVSRRQLDDIEALLPPSDLRDGVDEMIAEGRSATTTAEAQGLGFFEGEDDPWARTSALAADLGLDACATAE